ncbi:DUF1317 family protein [Dryocola clanedunensis]|jgi:hypothetical protein
MKESHDNIRCGTTVLRYYSAYGGWMLPDKTFTRNPLKAHRIAEETEAAKEHHKQEWELYELQLLKERNPNWNIVTIARRLDRTNSDVKNMLNAISASN